MSTALLTVQAVRAQRGIRRGMRVARSGHRFWSGRRVAVMAHGARGVLKVVSEIVRMFLLVQRARLRPTLARRGVVWHSARGRVRVPTGVRFVRWRRQLRGIDAVCARAVRDVVDAFRAGHHGCT
jgi:hypothetical protein